MHAQTAASYVLNVVMYKLDVIRVNLIIGCYSNAMYHANYAIHYCDFTYLTARKTVALLYLLLVTLFQCLVCDINRLRRVATSSVDLVSSFVI